jgi:hypothetical protein
MGDYETLGLELAKCVADRHAAYAELLGECLLGEACSGGETTREHVVAQAGDDLLGQRSGLQLRFSGDVVYRTRYPPGALGV